MTLRPKVGFHDFLNSKPILRPLREGEVDAPFELCIDTPARLADRFHEGELDMALIPSIEYGRNLDAVIIPVLCIASIGKVETVLLFSKVEAQKIESISVDPKSRTSVAVAQILLKELYGKDPAIIVGNDDPESMLRSADAGLLIGDLAYTVDALKYRVYDLGEMWYRYSSLPFVHAILCARKNERWDSAIEAIARARELAGQNRELIAGSEGGSPTQRKKILDYLTNRIYYDFGDQERGGLEKFLQIARSMGLAERADLEIYE